MKLDFRELNEPGVLAKSSGYLFTPLPYAKELYFYITQIGHYYCTHAYKIRRDYFSPILIVSVQAGCLHVVYRGSAYRLLAGDVMLIDCREPHYYYSELDGLEFYYLHFDGSNAHEICRHILEVKGPMVDKQNTAALAHLIKAAMTFYDEGHTETVFEESCRVYEIFRHLHGSMWMGTGDTSYVDTVTHYINENIGRRITLKELADTVMLSNFHFSRRFKRDTGFAPVEYVNCKKLDYAKNLLIRTDLTVTEIAEKTGFSIKGFIKFFSKAEGCPPLMWRKKMQQNIERESDLI